MLNVLRMLWDELKGKTLSLNILDVIWKIPMGCSPLFAAATYSTV